MSRVGPESINNTISYPYGFVFSRKKWFEGLVTLSMCSSQIFSVNSTFFLNQLWKSCNVLQAQGSKGAMCVVSNLLGAQSMNSRSSRAAPPLTSVSRIPSNITWKFLSFLSGTSARFQLLPWGPVLFQTSRKSFSVCGEEQGRHVATLSLTMSTLISASSGSNWTESCCCCDYSQTLWSINQSQVKRAEPEKLKWAEIKVSFRSLQLLRGSEWHLSGVIKV